MGADALADEALDVGDAGLQATQQLHLSTDHGGKGLSWECGGGGGRRSEPGEQFGWALSAAVGVPAAERGHTCLAEAGGRLRWGVVG